MSISINPTDILSANPNILIKVNSLPAPPLPHVCIAGFNRMPHDTNVRQRRVSTKSLQKIKSPFDDL